MLLWKGDHSSITSANWFVPTNSINSVKEKQLNRDRHRGQGGEEHCPFCRQPDLDYIPVKFGFTCGSGRTGLSLWTEAIYVRLGATETSEPHGDSCYTNTDSHQWFTSLLPPLWLALFGNGLVERRAVQSSQNTGCSYFVTFPLLQAATGQNTIHLILMEILKVSTHPCAALSMITPVTFTKPRVCKMCCSCWPGELSHVLLLGHCLVPAPWAKPSVDRKLKQLCELQQSPPCSRHRHNLYLNLNNFMVTQRLKAMPGTWSVGTHQEHPLKGPS